MRTTNRHSGLAVFLALAAALAMAPDAMAQRFVTTSDPAFPKVKYADSLVSVNDRCMVAQRKLSTTIRPVYVNGSPMGFC